MQKIIEDLKNIICLNVKNSKPSSILLSGGLDSSILAALYPNLTSVTISLDGKGDDLKYSKIIGSHLKLKYFEKNICIDEAIEFVPKVIRILKTFDPAIPNDLTTFLGIKFLKDLGFNNVMTGDGSDELFAGYSFMGEIKNLDEYILRIVEKMSFSSNKICDYFKIKIIQPYLEKNLIEYALKIPVKIKIVKTNNHIWGKWILRKSFENILPKEIIWQSKRPLEIGSGMTILREILSQKISDNEFEEAKRTIPVKFISKEHYYYYKIYLKEFGVIPSPKEYEKTCPSCGGGMEKTAFHCKICGCVLKWRNQ